MVNTRTASEDLPITVHNVLHQLPTMGQVPALCVVENDSEQRNLLLTRIACYARAAGERVIVAQQCAHDAFGVPTVDEQQAIWQAMQAIRDHARAAHPEDDPVLFVLPRLERPLTATVALLSALRAATGVYVVAGASTLTTGPAHAFADAWCPCNFPVLWAEDRLSGRQASSFPQAA